MALATNSSIMISPAPAGMIHGGFAYRMSMLSPHGVTYWFMDEAGNASNDEVDAGHFHPDQIAEILRHELRVEQGQ